MSRVASGTGEGLIKHGAILLAATVISGISNALYNVVMGRLLTTEQFGDYMGLASLFMILVLPFTAVQIVTARYVSALDGQRLLGQAAALLRRSLVKLSMGSVAVIVLFALAGPLLADYLNIHSQAAVLITGFSVSLGLLYPVMLGALQGFQYFYHYSINQIVSTFVKFGGGVLLVWLGFEVAGALGAMALFYLSALVMAAWPLNVVLFRLAGGDEYVDSRPHYRFFWSVFVSLLAYAVFTFADAITVKHFFDRTEAGEYGFALVVGKGFLYIAMAISTALFPKVSQRTASGERDSLGLLNSSLAYCLALCAAGLAVCAAVPELLLRLIFPQSSQIAVDLVRIFGLGVTPVALVHILINYLLARGRNGFLYIFVPLALGYAGALQIWHRDLSTVIWVMALFGLITACLLYVIVLVNERTEGATAGVGS